MKTLVLAFALLPVVGLSAEAKTVTLKGAAADDFIAKYFPDADIPGPIKGIVKCNVPAMGARSDGDVSTCSITLE